ncbi:MULTISPECIES: DUF6628 family protein [Sphingomonas]|uniref:DUF6628 family protein n=1 Tax=Sphingomonas TaxID=13687 RepID=UPI000A6B2724|nr:DUF6628 family protein [Sphingomonas sp. CCH10-B3]
MLPFALPTKLQRAVPDDPATALMLFALRRMSAHGVFDAVVATHFNRTFGAPFQRPLMLMRVLMSEVSQSARATIQLAPSCCPRMTSGEAALIEAALQLPDNPVRSRLLLADLLANRAPEGALLSLEAVVAAFADAGRPIGGRH